MDNNFKPKSDTASADIDLNVVNSSDVTTSSIDPISESNQVNNTQSTSSSWGGSQIHNSTPSEDVDDSSEATRGSSYRFLAAYITSTLSGLSLLVSGSFLGYVIFNHFINPDKNDFSFSDSMGSLYLGVSIGMLAFAILYFISSHYVGKRVINDDIKLTDWRAYKVIYSIFTAILLIASTISVAGLLYIPFANAFIISEYTGSEILISVLETVNTLVWAGILIWQERLAKNNKYSKLQGIVVAALALIFISLTLIFPVGSKTDERYDDRAVSDLGIINSAIETYVDKNDKLPTSLDQIDLDDEKSTKNRLSKYTFKTDDAKTTAESSSISLASAKLVQSSDSNVDDLSDESDYTFDYSFSSEDEEDSSSLEGLFGSSSGFSFGDTEESKLKYQLCADFKNDTSEDKEDSGISTMDILLNSTSYGSGSSFSAHKSGNHCFDLSI